jgi:MFS transporter, FSR family, fosmidomycin resistance protein
MSQATGLLNAHRAPHVRIVGAVSGAHFVSHYYIILLAPLLPFVRADYGVSYTEIGLAFAAFNIVSATLQTPAGFLVDRLGARVPLIGGLLIGAVAFIVAGLVHSFWVMVAMFALAGLGNTVYHPADYTMLSQNVSSKHIGQAFSVHTFAGMLGGAVAPPTLLLMHGLWGWRGAFVGAGILGFAMAAILLVMRDDGAREAERPEANQPKAEDTGGAGWRLLLSGPVLLNLGFFTFLAMISGGIFNYSVVAFGALFATPVTTANAALTAYLLLSAVGVLAGGLFVARVTNHGRVAALGLIAMAVLTLLVGTVHFGGVALVAVMTVNGFFFGFIMPSRDMLVREVTPPGSFGKVFGFVTTGFNIGGVISPLIFGALMDHGSPRWVFLLVAMCSLVAILTVAIRPRRPAAA